MLIVLDTSASMTGVPGGRFETSTESGIDCDNGVNCRLGGVQGICSVWKRPCQSNHDCRHGVCSADGFTICAGDADCIQNPGTCSSSGGTCWTKADCPPQSAVCTATGLPCDAEHACASVGHCTYGTNVLCSNPGHNCPEVGTCSTGAGVFCRQDADCPRAATGGICARGGTPSGGCGADSDCASPMRCQSSGDQCRADGDCPLYAHNYCRGGEHDGRPCRAASDCPGGQCTPPPANLCTGMPNVCDLAAGKCAMHSENRCMAIANTCSVPSNTCTMPLANSCQPPARATDTCVPNPQGRPGPIRMCTASQIACSGDSDCGASEHCGPATSRAVMVKRALGRVVMNNYDRVNFGLMTFWQDGYFPYYQVRGSVSIESVTAFKDEPQLRRAGCFIWDSESNTGGPSATCTINGRQMTLRATADSRYRAQDRHDYDVNFCGAACDMPDSLGRGVYQGSYYQYQRAVQVPTAILLTRNTYDGHDITVNGVNYTYYKPLPNYSNGGSSPPIDGANCGSACSATCGGRWALPFLDTTDEPAHALSAAQAITSRMDYAADGGIIASGGTPTGCTLENDIAKTPQTSAYDYMKAVKNGYTSAGQGLDIPADRVSNRNNFVLLVTDGAANGPGDVDSQGRTICDAPACAAENPAQAGCACRSVLAAYHLKRDLGVTVLVVGFSGDASDGSPALANHNLAKAGGSGSAFLAANPDQWEEALQKAIHAATQGH